jgi:hypothetical protein
MFRDVLVAAEEVVRVVLRLGGHEPVEVPAVGGANAVALLAFSSFAIGIVDCADAQPERWTIVGSAGTVDEADLGQVDLRGSAAGMKTEVLSGNAVIRYHVDLPGPPLRVGSGAVLEAVYLDPGPTSHVHMRLYGVVFDKDTGVKNPDLQLVSLTATLIPLLKRLPSPKH